MRVEELNVPQPDSVGAVVSGIYVKQAPVYATYRTEQRTILQSPRDGAAT